MKSGRGNLFECMRLLPLLLPALHDDLNCQGEHGDAQDHHHQGGEGSNRRRLLADGKHLEGNIKANKENGIPAEPFHFLCPILFNFLQLLLPEPISF